MNAPNAAASTAWSRSASSSTISGALPPSSSSTGFSCSAASFAMILPTLVGEIDPLHRGMRDQGLDDLWRILGRIAQNIHNALRETGVVQHLPDQMVGSGAELR